MGIFFTSRGSVVPEIHDAIRAALIVDPHLVSNADEEAAHRTADVVRTTAAEFRPLRFFCALLVSVALVTAAVWTAQHGLSDISKQLMNCFVGFSGAVLGLLCGESQKSASS
jgi:hypothetical protein